MKDLRRQFPIYSFLLRLYPSVYRQRYEQEILTTAADMLQDAPGRLAKLTVWTRLAVELPWNAGKQQMHYIGEGGFGQLPNYVKFNSLIAAILLLPFFTVLIANTVDKLLTNHNLYDTWLWQRPYIGLWILFFPTIALLLAMGSYLVYFAHTKTASRHNWLLLVPGAVAVGILFIVFFHDSFQCWRYAPWHIASHFRQSWQCTNANRVDFTKIFQRSL